MLKVMQCACLKGRRVRWIIRFQQLRSGVVHNRTSSVVGFAGDALRRTKQMSSRTVQP